MFEIAGTTERATIPPTTEVSNSTANESSTEVAANRFPSNFCYTFYHLINNGELQTNHKEYPTISNR